MSKRPKHVIAENDALMKEWDFDKNNALSLDPFTLGMTSHTKAWWKCAAGHSWYAMISNRSGHDRSCPYCAHQLVIPGETDLATLYPELAKEWHPTKNNLQPSEVMPGTHKKAWWVCAKGHEWSAEIKSRVSGVGCPYCARKKIRKYDNDLATMNPELASEWHPTKNGSLTPSDVSEHSGKIVWWMCNQYGHEWKASIVNRSKGRGCPKCSAAARTSFPEQAIYYYIKQVFPDAISGYKEIFSSSMELDIYIPSIKTAIEYDGKIYHSNDRMRVRDARKYKICKDHGIMLIRVREMSRPELILMCDHKIEIPSASDEYLNWAINNLCYHLGKIVMPDVHRDRQKILGYLNERRTSLASEFPAVASEWDYDVNAPLLPEQFPPHSNEKVGWRCSVCGHTWKATIGDRTRPESTGCPECARKRAAQIRTKMRIQTRGSLASLRPDLLEEWDYSKNDVPPESITTGSGKKVYWICKRCGYSWADSVSHRNSGRGCPLCSNRVVVPGKNDLATTRPDLLNEWAYEKNAAKGLTPTTISAGSGKRAFWICSVCGYEWESRIVDRTQKPGRCPRCAGKRK